MLTFIDGEPLKAGLLLRGSTVFHFITLGHLKAHELSLMTKLYLTKYLTVLERCANQATPAYAFYSHARE